MKDFSGIGLALLGSSLLHAAVFALLLPPVSMVGKNVPKLAYPVRVRVLSPNVSALNLVQRDASGSRIGAVKDHLQTKAPTPEGKLDSSSTNRDQIPANYVMSNELDTRPAIAEMPDLNVGEIGPTLEGSAILQIFVNENGEVDRLNVGESTLPEAMLEQLLRQHREIRFTPGVKNGVNVKSVITYTVELAKASAAVLPSDTEENSQRLRR